MECDGVLEAAKKGVSANLSTRVPCSHGRLHELEADIREIQRLGGIRKVDGRVHLVLARLGRNGEEKFKSHGYTCWPAGRSCDVVAMLLLVKRRWSACQSSHPNCQERSTANGSGSRSGSGSGGHVAGRSGAGHCLSRDCQDAKIPSPSSATSARHMDMVIVTVTRTESRTESGTGSDTRPTSISTHLVSASDLDYALPSSCHVSVTRQTATRRPCPQLEAVVRQSHGPWPATTTTTTTRITTLTSTTLSYRCVAASCMETATPSALLMSPYTVPPTGSVWTHRPRHGLATDCTLERQRGHDTALPECSGRDAP